MKPFLIFPMFLVAAGAAVATAAEAPKNELAFGLGGIPSGTRNASIASGPGVDLSSGIAFQVNYGRKFWNPPFLALYGELNFTASPQRVIASQASFATHDYAGLYITPGIRVKLLPGSRLSPFAVVGGGYGDYEQSVARLDGKKNSAPRELSRGVFDIGGGVDYRIGRFVALRGEVRDFYTGSPDYNIPSVSGGQHNVVATGSIVLRWR